MTLQKAIEVLTFLSREGTQDMELDDYAAVKLGIQALKCVKRSRGKASRYCIVNLPGETEA